MLFMSSPALLHHFLLTCNLVILPLILYHIASLILAAETILVFWRDKWINVDREMDYLQQQ